MTDIGQVLWNKSIDLLANTSVFNEGNGVSIDNRVIHVVYDLLTQLDHIKSIEFPRRVEKVAKDNRDKALRESLDWIRANWCNDWGKMIVDFEDHFNMTEPV